jgi:hypothetical protein
MARADDIDPDKQYDLLAKKDCEECKGTGLIETEGVVWGRSYYSKEHKQVVRDFHGDGNWRQTQCYCIGEDDD